MRGERQKLFRQDAVNEVCPLDFVFDRPAEGNVLKALNHC